nr:retrovirus-related Pol polyprotein from transposon TNT 1-94 [Tanacetum cinerariifolium]
MANLLEDIQCAGSDTRPPMLDRTDFASWKQHIPLYCRGKENAVNILKLINKGPFQMETFRETLSEGIEGALNLGPERPRVYSDLTPEEKDRYNANIRATNIILQGLPKDIYSLTNYYTNAKDIWDNVKMLLEGSELTKKDRESQLYDDFEHLRQNKGETIHDYYIWFAKLINDMWIIKMTMSMMQLNSKFVNNMLPEWDRFVTAVKLNRGLRDSNYDQLYAYLKQHETHANENKIMLDRFTQHTGRENRGQVNNTWGAGAAGYGGAQNRIRYANPDKMLLMQAQENRVALDDEQLLFITVDDYDAFDSDVDEAPTAQTMFMENLSFAYLVYDEAGPSYYSDILSEVHDHDHYQDAVCEHHEVHEMHDNVQPNYIVDLHADYTSDSNMIMYDQYVKDNAVPVVQTTFTPQKQLTLEQIFWSKDLIKMKAEALKEQTTASRSMKALTVKHDEIKRKNILIANDNLINDCLSKDVFYTTTESVLTVSRFSDMHEALNAAQKHIAELKSENSNL